MPMSASKRRDMHMRLWEKHRTMPHDSLGRFAPINLVGDRIDLECKDHGQIHEIVLLRSLMHRPCEHESMGDTSNEMCEHAPST